MDSVSLFLLTCSFKEHRSTQRDKAKNKQNLKKAKQKLKVKNVFYL